MEKLVKFIIYVKLKLNCSTLSPKFQKYVIKCINKTNKSWVGRNNIFAIITLLELLISSSVTMSLYLDRNISVDKSD